MKELESSVNHVIQAKIFAEKIETFAILAQEILKEKFFFSRALEFFNGQELLTVIGFDQEALLCEANNSELVLLETDKFTLAELETIYDQILVTLTEDTIFTVYANPKLQVETPLGNRIKFAFPEEAFAYLLELIE